MAPEEWFYSISRWNNLVIPEHVQYIFKCKSHFNFAILYELIRKKKSLNDYFLHYMLFIKSVLSTSEQFENTLTDNLTVVIVQ